MLTAMAEKERCRLCLITPVARAAEESARLVAAALAGGDVAAVLVAPDSASPETLQQLVEGIIATAGSREVATLVVNDTRIAGRTHADGVHIDTGLADVAAAVASARGRRMVGAGGIVSRHDAMQLAEAEPDYLFFGLLDGDRGPDIFARALDLAAWWAEVAVIPAVVMGGRSIASVDAAVGAGVDFVALRQAIWDDPRGPAAAVAEANERLARIPEAAR